MIDVDWLPRDFFFFCMFCRILLCALLQHCYAFLLESQTHKCSPSLSFSSSSFSSSSSSSSRPPPLFLLLHAAPATQRVFWPDHRGMATRAPEDHQEAPPAPQIKREPEDGLPRPPEPHSTPAAASQSPASDDREQTAAAAQDAQDADPAVDFAAADHADAGDDNHSGRSSESGRVTQACPFASYHYQTKTKVVKKK